MEGKLVSHLLKEAGENTEGDGYIFSIDHCYQDAVVQKVLRGIIEDFVDNPAPRIHIILDIVAKYNKPDGVILRLGNSTILRTFVAEKLATRRFSRILYVAKYKIDACRSIKIISDYLHDAGFGNKVRTSEGTRLRLKYPDGTCGIVDAITSSGMSMCRGGEFDIAILDDVSSIIGNPADILSLCTTLRVRIVSLSSDHLLPLVIRHFSTYYEFGFPYTPPERGPLSRSEILSSFGLF